MNAIIPIAFVLYILACYAFGASGLAERTYLGLDAWWNRCQ